MFSEWTPQLSGCYRPMFYFNTESHGTENNLVRPMEPVVLMVSEKSQDKENPGYDNGKDINTRLFVSWLPNLNKPAFAVGWLTINTSNETWASEKERNEKENNGVTGMYCKWLIKGDSVQQLKFRLDDVNIFPLQEQCGYDGLVVYDGDDTSGKMYGTWLKSWASKFCEKTLARLLCWATHSSFHTKQGNFVEPSTRTTVWRILCVSHYFLCSPQFITDEWETWRLPKVYSSSLALWSSSITLKWTSHLTLFLLSRSVLWVACSKRNRVVRGQFDGGFLFWHEGTSQERRDCTRPDNDCRWWHVFIHAIQLKEMHTTNISWSRFSNVPLNEKFSTILVFRWSQLSSLEDGGKCSGSDRRRCGVRRRVVTQIPGLRRAWILVLAGWRTWRLLFRHLSFLRARSWNDKWKLWPVLPKYEFWQSVLVIFTDRVILKCWNFWIDVDAPLVVLEVPRDAEKLKLYEIHLIKICGENGLFITPSVIKVRFRFCSVIICAIWTAADGVFNDFYESPCVIAVVVAIIAIVALSTIATHLSFKLSTNWGDHVMSLGLSVIVGCMKFLCLRSYSGAPKSATANRAEHPQWRHQQKVGVQACLLQKPDEKADVHRRWSLLQIYALNETRKNEFWN